jgi:DNA-binding NtrC family response regulator
MVPGGNMEKILLVDDEQKVHSVFRRVLADQYEVESAFSGEEALRRVANEPPRLVVMDVQMPGGGGLHALQEIKRVRPELPVIMTSPVMTAELAIRQPFLMPTIIL